MDRIIHTIGKLAIEYQAYGHSHTFSVGLLSTCQPNDFATCDLAANDLAGVVKGMMNNMTTITGWHSLNQFGQRVLENTITPPLVGGHAQGGQAFRSNTLTFTGRGAAINSTTQNGNTRMVVHVFDAFPPDATETKKPVSTDIVLGQIANFLRVDTRIWSDFNGNKATVNGYVTQQFNAHTQRHEGA